MRPPRSLGNHEYPDQRFMLRNGILVIRRTEARRIAVNNARFPELVGAVIRA